MQLENLEYWNEQFDCDSYFIGTHPTEFLRERLPGLKKGKILLPGEGEGRNAVYAAKLGWKVDAFDFCSVAMEKALALADEHKVSINYRIDDFESFKATPGEYDVIAVLDLPTSYSARETGLKRLRESLKSGGLFIYEGFTPDFGECWTSVDELDAIFRPFKKILLTEVDVVRYHEQQHHHERVVRMLALKSQA